MTLQEQKTKGRRMIKLFGDNATCITKLAKYTNYFLLERRQLDNSQFLSGI